MDEFAGVRGGRLVSSIARTELFRWPPTGLPTCLVRFTQLSINSFPACARRAVPRRAAAAHPSTKETTRACSLHAAADARVHARRVARRHRHHRRAGRAVAARDSGRARSGPARPVSEQSQANWTCGAKLRIGQWRPAARRLGLSVDGRPRFGQRRETAGRVGIFHFAVPRRLNSLCRRQGTGPRSKGAELAKQRAFPISAYFCPSRRPPRINRGQENPVNSDRPPNDIVAKIDYAANGGSYCPKEGNSSQDPPQWWVGPPLACATNYPGACNFDAATTPYTKARIDRYFNGPVVPRLPVEMRQISDGAANTMFAAEKYLHLDFWGDVGLEITTNSCSDNGSAYQGYDWDVIRWAIADQSEYIPQPDSFGPEACTVRFGGPHNSVFLCRVLRRVGPWDFF